VVIFNILKYFIIMMIYVGRLSYLTTEEELRKLFEQYGEVTDVTLRRETDNGDVNMNDETAAFAAINALDKSDFLGRKIAVSQERIPKGGNEDEVVFIVRGIGGRPTQQIKKELMMHFRGYGAMMNIINDGRAYYVLLKDLIMPVHRIIAELNKTQILFWRIIVDTDNKDNDEYNKYYD